MESIETMKKVGCKLLAGVALAHCGVEAPGSIEVVGPMVRKEDAIPEEHTHSDVGIAKPNEVRDQNVAAITTSQQQAPGPRVQIAGQIFDPRYAEPGRVVVSTPRCQAEPILPPGPHIAWAKDDVRLLEPGRIMNGGVAWASPGSSVPMANPCTTSQTA